MFKFLVLLSLISLCSCKKNELPSAKLVRTPYHDKADSLRNRQSSDSAFYYSSISKDIYLQNRDTVRTAQSLINMAIIECNKGDYFGSIETSLEADTLLIKKRDSIARGFLAANYNNLAIASNGLKNYNNAMKFYITALNNVKSAENKYVYYNNIGDVLITKKDYKKALKFLAIALKTRDSFQYARALNNWARAKYLNDKRFYPIPYYSEALKIRKQGKNSIDLNSSYANFCDYYTDTDRPKALDYAHKMENAAVRAHSLPDQMQALRWLINLDPENYNVNFEKFLTLNAENQLELNRAKNQFALIRYGVEKSKAENGILKVDKLEDQKKMIYLVVAIVGLVVILIVSTVGYRKRRRRLQQEKELEGKRTELKYSKKVHDVVANGIYQVMTKLENNLEISKNETLDDLEEVYNKSRNISYDRFEAEESPEAFSEKIRKLIGYFNTDKVKTILAGNDASVWEGVNYIQKGEVYQILRELLINMKKHSYADRVTLRFNRTDKRIKVYYLDTGIGIKKETIFKNGMRNMESRIKNLEGVVIFDIEKEKGLHVNFSFSLNK